ncbi:MAG: DUF4437 domain-containing protein [Alphaproteobacteria bacterium]|nr:DUF4437 domain-containing protein [Alphaproteobacteria bacterium]
MPRPHCMFIQAQDVPWSKGFPGGGWDDLDVKVLSLDEATGACSTVVRYPTGWERNGNRYLTCHEEFLVLEGTLVVNSVAYGPYAYANLPAGYARQSVSSPDGAVVLTMLSATPHEADGMAPDGVFDDKLLVEQVDVAPDGLEGWTENPYTRYLMGTGVRPLREDPYTGEISILYAALPFRFMEKEWTHPTVQEMFVLSGEYAINDVGVMCPGSYAWWEPENLHGPYGSHTGFMMFIRTVGGKLANKFGKEGIAVDYDAPYKPVVESDTLKPYAKAPVRSTLY